MLATRLHWRGARPQIAQNLAFINWTVLTGLALGTYAAVILLRRRSNATRGYLGFATGCAIAFGLLAWLSDGALPSSLGTSPIVARCGLGRAAPGRPAAFCAVAALALVARRVRRGVAGHGADRGERRRS